ncbi:MAG: methyltransferase [Planctomycetota bacterium]|nr:MAG: methyltransferase [Planctomycetota bacterium]
MNSRERVAAALNHKEPDRIPIDFGAGGQTGIMASTLYKIKKHYGLLEENERIKIVEPYQMLGEVDEKIQDVLGLDVVGVHPLKNMFGFRDENFKPWTLFDGTPVWVPQLFNTEPDENGNILMYAQGNHGFPPSAKMPKNGFYFDSIIRQNHFDPDNLNPKDNTEEFAPLSDEDLGHFSKEVNSAYENTDRAIYLTFPGAAFGDIALVPATFLKEPRGIRDVAEWYMSIALRPDYIMKVFEIQTEVAVENLKAVYKAVADKVQVVFMSGTDFGSQKGPMISESTYRKLFFPFQKKLNDWVHKNTPWKTFMHCCGSIEPLLEGFIEAGFDILNPVQCSAANMAPAMLKAKYGDRIAFWGGGVDTQKTLPSGTPQQVKTEVTERIKIFKKSGGFVFNAIHNIQADVPVENFVAMLEAYSKNCAY